MTDGDGDSFAERLARRTRETSSRESSSRDLIESAVRKIVTAIVIAGGVIALGIYSRPGPPRFQAFAAAEGQIVRIDTRSGTVLACEGNQCMTVVRRGQRLRPTLPSMAPKQEARMPAELPAPSPETAPVKQ